MAALALVLKVYVLVKLLFVTSALLMIIGPASSRADKRIAYAMAAIGSIPFVIGTYLLGDPYLAAGFLILFAWRGYSDRAVFLGSTEQRQWRKWPWY